jgi:hypothetical protein
VPTNKYNVFALGKWDINRWVYQGHAGKLILYNKDQEIIAIGTKID